MQPLRGFVFAAAEIPGDTLLLYCRILTFVNEASEEFTSL